MTSVSSRKRLIFATITHASLRALIFQLRANVGARHFECSIARILQQLLLNEVSSHQSITIKTNARLETFETMKSGVTLKYEGIGGGVTLAASGLVGADGLRSIVRDRMVKGRKMRCRMQVQSHGAPLARC